MGQVLAARSLREGRGRSFAAAHAPLRRRAAAYGYRRISVLVNRELAQDGLPPANRKRIHRITQRHALLLECHTGRRKGRLHAGKVMVMHSNLRWCSDGLEFTCWNGEVIRMAFIIDAFDREIIAFDREIIAWMAVCGTGISGSDVRDMMLEAVERRFNAMRAPHPIEHLSDNGNPYTARDTREFAAALNLVPCFMPVCSPESNGLSEAFVKTFKRDYVRVNPLPDAQTALRQVAGWIDDYNEIHPHSALRMRSPREFIRAQAQ
jgi:putative transposase